MNLSKSLSILLLPLAAFALPPVGVADDPERTLIQTSEAFDNDTGAPVPGAAILTRSKGKVEVSMHMSSLDPNTAYTAWWIIFNNPDNCTDPGCGLDDLGGPGEGEVFYANGYISDGSGVANAYATLKEKFVPEEPRRLLSNFVDLPQEVGLQDAEGAEIHMIIARSHGAPLAGSTAEQIGTFDGQCGGGPNFPACADQQFVVFPPPEQ